MLTLPEQLTLLSTDERGRNQFSVPNLMNSALVGAALLQLLWAEAIAITEEQVTFVRRVPLASNSLNAVAALIANAPTPLSAAEWTRLSRSPLPDLRGSFQHHLLAQGLFVQRPCRKLLIFPSTFLAPEPAARERAVREMREALLGPSPEDLRQQALGALVDASGIIYRAFRTIEELRPARERAGELGQALTAATADAGTRLIMQGVYAAWRSETEGGVSMS